MADLGISKQQFRDWQKLAALAVEALPLFDAEAAEQQKATQVKEAGPGRGNEPREPNLSARRSVSCAGPEGPQGLSSAKHILVGFSAYSSWQSGR